MIHTLRALSAHATALVVSSVLLVGALAVSPSRAEAQATAADSARVVLATARDFEARGEWEVAEALYHFIAERWGSTPAARTARERLSEGEREGMGRGGQVELQVWTTLYGLWLGVAVPGAFDAQESEPYGVGLLLGGPAGFLSGRALSRGRALSPGQVRAITFGGTWGTWQGLGWVDVLDVGGREICGDFGCYAEDPEAKYVFRGMVLGGVAGIATGALLARRPISHATATAVNYGALWGTWFGIATAVLTDQDDTDDGGLAWALMGGNAGLVTTALVAPRLGWSRNRYRLVSIAGVIGGLGGAGIDLITTPDSEKAAVAVPLITSVIGLGLGVALTSDYDGEADDAPAAGLDGALLSYRDGRLELGAPIPVPRILELDTPRGLRRRTALGVSLFRARFR